MRVALIGDSHFCEGLRFDECVRIHAWITDDLERRGVDLVLHSGDIFHKRSTPTERTAVATWVQGVARLGPVVIVGGNHDQPVDLEIFGRLETPFPVVVVEGAALVPVHDANGMPLARVACVAWPRKANLLAHLLATGGEAAATPEASSRFASEALRTILRGFAEYQADDVPLILLAHALVTGSVTSSGQPLVGHDMELGLEDLALSRAALIALGHIHKGQDWAHGAVPIVYPGSPRRTDFGELEPKGYVIADFDGPRLVGWERIETPATPMLHIDACWKDGPEWDAISGVDAWTETAGAEVRFRYTVDADQRDAARAAAELSREDMTQAGAVLVKLEEIVRPKTRARAPEIAAAMSLEAKLEALWKARGEELGDRAARLIDKAKIVQLEASS